MSKAQVLIAEKSHQRFTNEINRYFGMGYTVIPGTSYAIYIPNDEEAFFSIVLWKNGSQLMVTGDDERRFVTAVNQNLDFGYKAVVGTLYAVSVGASEQRPKDYDRLYFNVLNLE